MIAGKGRIIHQGMLASKDWFRQEHNTQVLA